MKQTLTVAFFFLIVACVEAQFAPPGTRTFEMRPVGHNTIQVREKGQWASVGAAAAGRANMPQGQVNISVQPNIYLLKEQHVRDLVNKSMKRELGENSISFKKRKEAEIQRLLLQEFESSETPAKGLPASAQDSELASLEESSLPEPDAETTQAQLELEQEIQRKQGEYKIAAAQLDSLAAQAQVIQTKLDTLILQQQSLEAQLQALDEKYQAIYQVYAQLATELGLEP